MKLLLLALLPAVSLAVGGQRLVGAPQGVAGDLNADQQEIVDFAFAQLSTGATGDCRREVVSVDNFKEQVVAGTKYTFDLVLKPHKDNGAGCPTATPTGSCQMAVWSKPWEKFREVQWDEVTCVKVEPLAVGGLAGAPQGVTGDLNAGQQEIVDFAFAQLSTGATGDCRREVLSVDNFKQQVVSGTMYTFDLVLKPHNDNGAGCPPSTTGSCRMAVWSKPWEKFREVQWDQVTCNKDA